MDATNSPLNLAIAGNPLLSLELSLGQTSEESRSPDGTHASAKATLVRAKVSLVGGVEVAAVDILPLSVEANAPRGGVSCADTDRDGDGLDNIREATLGTNPDRADSDADGLKDGAEVAGASAKYRGCRTNPRVSDSDRDGLVDGREVRRTRTNPCAKDTDRDGLADGREVRGPTKKFPKCRTNPLLKNTDRHGAHDGAEVRKGTNPCSGAPGRRRS